MFNSNASTASSDANYIEDVFSTYLYTGNTVGQTITNGIDLSTKGGLVWCKDRNSGVMGHHLVDTVRGATKDLQTQSANGQTTVNTVTAFTTSGFTLGTSTDVNTASILYASWTFREQEKFFDVVTYTGDGAASNPISHNLKSVPGFIIVKKTSGTGDWIVCNRFSDTNWFGGNSTVNWGLNSTAAAGAGIDPTTRGITSTTVDVSKLYGTAGSFDATKGNASGATYVMYMFAHNAGGFGLTGTDNVVSCGGFSTDGSGNATLDLGYEPQWIIIKNADSSENWVMFDNMRGWTNGSGGEAVLNPNLADAESAGNYGNLTSTGATWANLTASKTYSYLAIRRGPMKVPTSGTSVFTPAVRTGTNTLGETITNANFPVDLIIGRNRASAAAAFVDRLRGINYMRSDNTDAEASATNYLSSLAAQSGWVSSTGGSGFWNTSPNSYIQWYFKRAPSFFDEVCYTGTGSATTFSHNLGSTPELMIVKKRSAALTDWCVYPGPLATPATKILFLDTTDSVSTVGSTVWNSTAPTSSVFSVGTDTGLNASGATYVAYLFATCLGVSKVGSYTGTGTTQQINCGFTAGSRFVLIKRTDSTGDWYVWDSARGIVAGNDPYLLLNTSGAEVTSTDYVDTYAAGFELSSTAPAALNASGGTYIFLAIA